MRLLTLRMSRPERRLFVKPAKTTGGANVKKSSIRWHRLGVSVGGSLAIGAMTLIGATAPAVAAPRLYDSLSNETGLLSGCTVSQSEGEVTDTIRIDAGTQLND